LGIGPDDKLNRNAVPSVDRDATPFF
jgi:hypothetical protein